MKLKLIYLILFIVAVIGLIAYGYFRAVPGVENQSVDRPEIIIIPASFDFGDVAYGDLAEYTFKVKNLGKKTLEINKIATSCGCTTAEVEKEILNPGEETNLFVKYNTGLMSGAHAKGEQERIIYIKSNDPLTPQIEATIKAYVR